MTRIDDLREKKQSVWLDYISRELLESGGLDRWIELGIAGVTTNPSIFENAIAKTNAYDEEIGRLSREGLKTAQIYERLVCADVRQAADILEPVYDATEGLDGYVSLEVDPLLAADAPSTVSEALSLYEKVGRPNVMIKIPATAACIGAIEEVLSMGVPVNATLIFSQKQYADVADAFARARQRSPRKVASVASVFVSRIDTTVDAVFLSRDPLEEKHRRLLGRIAVDNAHLCYHHYCEWKNRHEPAHPGQRLLWASTGTKNKAYSETLYVDSLVLPETVNTVPVSTLEAFLNGNEGIREASFAPQESQARLGELAAYGIDLDAVCAKLLGEGVAAFEKAFSSLLKSIELKSRAQP